MSFYGSLSGFIQVSQYHKKHSPTHTFLAHQPSFINFLHLPQSTASRKSFCTTSLQVPGGLLLGMEPSTSYSIISSPNCCLPLKTHAHTIATCFVVVLRLRQNYNKNRYLKTNQLYCANSTDWLKLSANLTVKVEINTSAQIKVYAI